MSGGLLTPAEEFAITVGARIVLPSRLVTDPKFVYTPRASTDLRKVFERVWAQSAGFDDENPYRPRW